MFAIVDQGADALLASGRITPESADALKAEARRRSDDGEFFGHRRTGAMREFRAQDGRAKRAPPSQGRFLASSTLAPKRRGGVERRRWARGSSMPRTRREGRLEGAGRGAHRTTRPGDYYDYCDYCDYDRPLRPLLTTATTAPKASCSREGSTP